VEIAHGLAESILFERYSGQLDGKSLVARGKPGSSQQSASGFWPAFQMSESYTVVIVEIGRSVRRGLKKPRKFLPVFLFKKLFGGRRLVSLRVSWYAAVCREKKQQSAKMFCRDCLPQGLKPVQPQTRKRHE
jgi:hypothetical protein